VPEIVGDQIKYDSNELVVTFLTKEVGDRMYVYPLLVDLNSQEDTDVIEMRGKIECHEIS